MYILTVHWDLIALWAILSLTAKFYMVCLLASAVTQATYFFAPWLIFTFSARRASRLKQS